MIQIKKQFPELLTLKEASLLLRCHPNTLRQWDRKRILPAIRIGEKRVLRYKKDDLVKFLNNGNR